MRPANKALEIRAERVSDYAAIAAVHARAFDNRSYEPVIVGLSRQRSVFDPELSLVAAIDECIVAHALFSPHTIRLLDEDVQAVNLAPIAVDPRMQGNGIGSMLIEEGHRIAASKGFAVSFLLGHATYYPRFGYRTLAYGQCQVSTTATSMSGGLIEPSPPVQDDIPGLRDLWRHDEGNVDFSIDPGPDLLDWISPNPAVETAVYKLDRMIVGCVRIHRDEPQKPRFLLARDGEIAQMMVRSVATRYDVRDMALPVHPASKSASGLPESVCTGWNAAMAMSLAPTKLDQYFELVQSGKRAPGRPIWPVAFDLD